MLKQLYGWTLNLARSPRAPVALGAVSFSESPSFPVPPDVMLVPMVMARPARAWQFAAMPAPIGFGILGGFAAAKWLF